MPDHFKLMVWLKAHALSNAIRETSRQLVPGTGSGVAVRLAKESAAIAERIADGAGQQRGDQFVRCLESAITSSYQVERQLARASTLGLPSDQRHRLTREVRDVRRMLIALQRRRGRRSHFQR